MTKNTISKRDKKAFTELEKILTTSKYINPKAIQMIEDQFSVYAYLKSLIEMRKEEYI